jgi:phosphohistidine phosphatase
MPTLVDLLRHGEAVPSHPDGDAARPLSPKGVAAIEAFAISGPIPDRIFTSPLVRARETGALVCAALGRRIQAEVLPVLVPDSEPSEVVAALAAEAPGVEHVLLVGHQPLLGDLAGHLCDGTPRALPPGGLIRLEFGGRPARRAGRVMPLITPA